MNLLQAPPLRPVRPAVRPAFRVLRLGAWFSVRIRPRAVLVSLALLAAILTVAVVTLTTGDYRIPVPDVVRALLGGGDPGTRFVVDSLRLPRLATGILVGLALGASGAVFQGVTRNPLGSPDVIGFGTGAASGAVAVLVLAHGGPGEVALGALAGGLTVATAVYLLALRGRGIQGFRLVLIGIGVTGMLTAFNQWMLTRASLNDALTAQIWLTGSLNSRGWQQAGPLALALLLLLPPLLLLGPRADQLELGDDSAHTLGLRVERTRLTLMALAVGLVASATAAAGPIGFVALAAPQISRRLTRSPGAGFGPAALTGALLVPLGDLAAQHVLSSELPVGVATGALGGVYLAFLLAAQWRSSR
ncbi:iron chelate uptake ABC transporter family permease subunit [Kitasatospora sp. NPDC096077]|uniref:FecCD family ABC transporter permease n=1 Tax=Kitasatospora sp. NPDC096077 TaxID=3155544 RepID=UPI0033231F9B